MPSGVAPARRAVSSALLAAITALVVLGLRAGVVRSKQGDTLGAITAAGLSGSVLLAGVLAVFGDALLDYRRCPIRSWLAAAAFVALTLGATALAPLTRMTRRITVASGLLLAAVILLGVPAKDHAFRGGPAAPNFRVMLVSASVLIVVAIAAALPLASSSLRRRLAFAGGSLIVISLAWFLDIAIPYRESSLPPVDSLASHLAPTATVASLMCCAVAAASMRLRLTSIAAIHVRLAGVGAAIVASVAVAVDRLATISPYVAYHLGHPRLGMEFSAAGVAVAFATVLASPVIWRQRATSQFGPGASASLLIVAALAGALFFARASLLNADPGVARALLAVDAHTGRIDWMHTALVGPADSTDRRNSGATPTPVAGENVVCAYFGSAGVFCVDFAGRLLWKRTDVAHDSFYGAASSPVIAGRALVLTGETPAGEGWITALDLQAGSTLWRRTHKAAPTNTGHSRTPLVLSLGGREAILIWGVDTLRAVEAASGEELWTKPIGSSGDFVASMVAHEGMLYLSSGSGSAALAIDGLPGTAAAWTQPAARANCASPVVCSGYLLMVTDRGIVSAVDINTGVIAWRQRLEGEFYSSPIATGERVYFTNTEGMTTVLSCGAQAQVLARNGVAAGVFASPAIANGRLYLRTGAALTAIGDR